MEEGGYAVRHGQVDEMLHVRNVERGRDTGEQLVDPDAHRNDSQWPRHQLKNGRALGCLVPCKHDEEADKENNRGPSSCAGNS